MTTAQKGDAHALLRQYAALIKTYADAVAENVRLREAMNKYSEDEMLNNETIERCANACEKVYEGYEKKCDEGDDMNDETMELVKRHREAAHQQGVIVGVVCTGAVMIVITLIVKLMGVTCG